MALVVLAYPEISDADFNLIQEYRSVHDELYYWVVKPHFTLVFPVRNWEAEPFIGEVSKQAGGIAAFDFRLCSAVINKDVSLDYYHTFLVPDEGFGRFIRLHDTLYAGKLFPSRALEIDFIPHVGVGNSRDPQKCLEMVGEWNAQEFSITGRIRKLDVAVYENDTVETLQIIPLIE